MENIIVQKELFQNFVTDFEKLLIDFEKIVETSIQLEAKARLDEMKSGKVETLSEEDYQKFIKKKGIKDD